MAHMLLQVGVRGGEKEEYTFPTRKDLREYEANVLNKRTDVIGYKITAVGEVPQE